METIESNVLDSTTGGTLRYVPGHRPFNPYHAPWGAWPAYRPSFSGWWPGRMAPRAPYWPWAGWYR